MAEKGRIRKVFAGGNTTMGFYSLFHHMIKPDAVHILVIKGGPGTGKSTFMTRIGEELVKRGYDIEHHYCSSDPDSLDGMVVPAINVALLDGTAPHIIDPKNPGAVDEIINLGECWDERKIVEHKEQILRTNNMVSRYFSIAYSMLRESKVAYDEYCSYIADSVDRAKYNGLAKLLMDSVFDGVSGNYASAPGSRHLFASAITPKGIIDFKDTLIKGMRLYAVDGRPGTGVKELIAKAAMTAEDMGLYTEQYHCPYEPDKIDMVLIPDINAAVLNTGSPFHTGQTLSGVEFAGQIDLDSTVRNELTEEFDPEIHDAEKRYRYMLDNAIVHLNKAMRVHDDIEEFYINAMDFNKVNNKRDEILNRILSYL